MTSPPGLSPSGDERPGFKIFLNIFSNISFFVFIIQQMEKLYNDNLHKGANGKLYEFSRELRQAETETEKILWELLRNKKLRGLKFRRQHPLGNYVAGFYCHEKKLVIELDGAIHDTKENIEYDKTRTDELNKAGINVVRFRNEEVINDIKTLIRKIGEFANK